MRKGLVLLIAILSMIIGGSFVLFDPFNIFETRSFIVQNKESDSIAPDENDSKREQNAATVEVLPTNYSLEFAYSAEKLDSKNETREFHHSGKGGCVRRNYLSDPGWIISDLRLVKEWGASSNQQIINVSSSGFEISLCVKPQNKPFQGYPPGYRHAIYTWVESKINYVSRLSSSEGEFDQTHIAIISFPKDFSNIASVDYVSLELKFTNGNSIVYSNAEDIKRLLTIDEENRHFVLNATALISTEGI